MHQFLPTRKSMWKCCMYCNKLFRALNSMLWDGKPTIKPTKLVLQRTHSKRTHQRHYPSSCIPIFGMVDNRKNFLSNTNQQHFRIHKSWLNKSKNYKHLSRTVIPRDIRGCSRYQRFRCWIISKSFDFPYRMKRNNCAAIRLMPQDRYGTRWKWGCKWKRVDFGWGT